VAALSFFDDDFTVTSFTSIKYGDTCHWNPPPVKNSVPLLHFLWTENKCISDSLWDASSLWRQVFAKRTAHVWCKKML